MLISVQYCPVLLVALHGSIISAANKSCFGETGDGTRALCKKLNFPATSHDVYVR